MSSFCPSSIVWEVPGWVFQHLVDFCWSSTHRSRKVRRSWSILGLPHWKPSCQALIHPVPSETAHRSVDAYFWRWDECTICKGSNTFGIPHWCRKLYFYDHQGKGWLSRKNPPVGPSSGSITASDHACSPVFTGRPPVPPISVATSPDRPTRIPELLQFSRRARKGIQCFSALNHSSGWK